MAGFDSGFEDESHGAEAIGIVEAYARRITGLRERFRAWEIPAVMRAAREEKVAALRGLRERRAARSFEFREELRNPRDREHRFQMIVSTQSTRS